MKDHWRLAVRFWLAAVWDLLTRAGPAVVRIDRTTGFVRVLRYSRECTCWDDDVAECARQWDVFHREVCPEHFWGEPGPLAPCDCACHREETFWVRPAV